jgi:hypothetical protein
MVYPMPWPIRYWKVYAFEKHIVTIGPPYFGATQKNCNQWNQWEEVYHDVRRRLNHNCKGLK